MSRSAAARRKVVPISNPDLSNLDRLIDKATRAGFDGVDRTFDSWWAAIKRGWGHLMPEEVMRVRAGWNDGEAARGGKRNPRLARPQSYVLTRHAYFYPTDPPMAHKGEEPKHIPSGLVVSVLRWGSGKNKRAYATVHYEGQDWYGWVDKDLLEKTDRNTNPSDGSSVEPGQTWEYCVHRHGDTLPTTGLVVSKSTAGVVMADGTHVPFEDLVRSLDRESNPSEGWSWESLSGHPGWSYGVRNINKSVTHSTPLYVVGAKMPNGNVLSDNASQEGLSSAWYDAKEWAEKRAQEFSRKKKNPHEPSSELKKLLRKLTENERYDVVRHADRILYAAISEGFDSVKAREMADEAAVRKAREMGARSSNPAGDYWVMSDQLIKYGGPFISYAAAQAYLSRHSMGDLGETLWIYKQGGDVAGSQSFVRVRPKLWHKGKRNPENSAADLYEHFHGRPSEEIAEITEQIHEHSNYTGLGDLIEITFRSLTGYEVTLDFAPSHVMLASSEDGKQLFVIGGDQEVNLEDFKMDGDDWVRDSMVLGVIDCIVYRTEKKFDKFETIEYDHSLGEESGVQPFLIYDPRSPKLYISGGRYAISDKTVDGVSEGLID